MKRFKFYNVALLMVFAVAFSCGTANVSAGKKKGYTEEGMASWYGKKFHGKKTASGEKFNMHKLTAAHKKLPFGTVVEVTNLKNGKKVKVRINDRGPFVKGRIIDLSYAAAKKIGIIEAGVARVRIKIVKTAGQ